MLPHARTGSIPEGDVAPKGARQWPVALGISALFGAVAALVTAVASSPRPALTLDSMFYLNAAQNFARGHGFVLTLLPAGWTGAGGCPYAAWPPLYPAVLAAALPAFSDPIAAARAVQIAVAAATAIPVGILAYRAAGMALLGPVLALHVALLPAVQTASFVWSESLYTLLSYGAFALVIEALRDGRYHASRRDTLLILAGIVAGCTMLTRYLGMSVILSVCILLVIHSDEEISGRRTLRLLLLFAVPAILMNVPWLVRNHAVTGYVFGENRGTAPIDVQKTVLAYFHTFWGNTVVPASLEGRRLPLPEVVAGIAAAAVLLATAATTYGPHTSAGNEPRGRIASLLLIHLTVYSIILIVVTLRVTFDPITTRFLTPVYPGVLILVGFTLRPLFAGGSGRRVRLVRSLVACAGASLLLIHASAVARYIRSPFESRDLTRPYWRSILFSDPAWRDDPVMTELTSRTPEGALVLSNIADAVALWTGRTAQFVPFYNDPRAEDRIVSRKGAYILVHPEHRRMWVGRDHLEPLADRGLLERLGPCGKGILYRVPD